MGKNRLETLFDGVLAIIITIMVLEMHIPSGHIMDALWPLAPVIFSYVMSFIYLGIYWNNHHHLMHTVKKINGVILWANLHLLFWLSLIPFTTAWAGESHFTSIPMMLYGIVLLCNAIAYFILQNIILKHHENDSLLAKTIGKNYKGKISIVLYAVAIGFSLYNPIISGLLYSLVAFIWLVPDKRIEQESIN